MFKILHTNKLPILILVLIITIFSCDGRKTKNDSLEESIAKFKDSTNTIEVVEYIPNSYSEIKTDTILSNGFTVKISAITDMNNFILKEIKKDSNIVKQHHRKRILHLKIFLKESLVFDNQIDIPFLKKDVDLLKLIKEQDLIISDLRIDPKTSLSPKTELYLDIVVYNPNDKLDKRFKLHFDKFGNYTFGGSIKGYPIEI